MNTMVSIFDWKGQPIESVMLEDGEKRQVRFPSEFLVSAGQNIEIGVSVHPIKPRDLSDIIDEIRSHVRQNPSHGYNCICMDQLIREFRMMVLDRVTTAGEKSQRQIDEDWNVVTRVGYVIETALRHA